jgi:hypothetical protein
MRLSRLLLGLLLVVDIAHGAAGSAWEGMKGPRAIVPTLKQAATAVPVIPIIDDPLGDHLGNSPLGCLEPAQRSRD